MAKLTKEQRGHAWRIEYIGAKLSRAEAFREKGGIGETMLDYITWQWPTYTLISGVLVRERESTHKGEELLFRLSYRVRTTHLKNDIQGINLL